MNTGQVLDCLVVGAGPAGLTAALYLLRFHRCIAVVGGEDSRARYIPRSHNFPGFPQGIGGVELLGRLHEQTGQLGGHVEARMIRALEWSRDEGLFTVMSDEARYVTRNVLLATGAVDHSPLVPGVTELRDRGLLRQCPICDGFEATGRRIGVIGRGSHGVREALFLQHFSDNVCLLTPSGRADLSEEDERCLRAAGIPGVIGPIRELRVHSRSEAEVVTQEGAGHVFDVVYSALGARPRSELAAMLDVPTDELGNLVVDSHCATRVPGLYAAGDVTSGLDQISVAIGQAAIAATAIHNRLFNRRG